MSVVVTETKSAKTESWFKKSTKSEKAEKTEKTSKEKK